MSPRRLAVVATGETASSHLVGGPSDQSYASRPQAQGVVKRADSLLKTEAAGVRIKIKKQTFPIVTGNNSNEQQRES
ncbi:MAG: hypothetical protein M1840_001949 [Geoglossum simile]|nr:MAG: hypothetical protein M1840_001949 [Geoglossum simile]